MRNYLGFILISFFGLTFSSCKKEKITVSMGYNYFPNNVGHYVIYDVDSTIYDDFKKDTTYTHQQVKELIESTYTDNLGRPAFRIERYVRSSDTSAWILSDVWSECRTATTAEKVEENIRYVKLIFPPKKSKTWKGNAYNNLGDWDYQYNDVDIARTIGSISFDSTLSVTDVDETNLIERKYYYEIYARNVGLVFRDVIDVSDNDFAPAGLPVEDRINKGYKLKMTIKSYGN
jgi:hypothetical protein